MTYVTRRLNEHNPSSYTHTRYTRTRGRISKHIYIYVFLSRPLALLNDAFMYSIQDVFILSLKRSNVLKIFKISFKISIFSLRKANLKIYYLYYHIFHFPSPLHHYLPCVTEICILFRSWIQISRAPSRIHVSPLIY